MQMIRHLAQRFRRIPLALVACLLVNSAAPVQASPLDWLFGKTVAGSGTIEKQTRALDHFTGISAEIPAEIILRQGNDEGVTIETDANLLPLIETVVEDRVLKIRPLRKHTSFGTNTLKVVIDARRIRSLATSTSGLIHAESLHAPTLRVAIGGSGVIDIKTLDSETLSVSVGGSGAFKAGGKADDVSASIGGSGSLQAGRLSARTASISIGGSGQGVVWARESLSVSVAGSGSVRYYGDPKVRTSIAGSGSVTRLGDAPN